jgi:excisionase family DNA binding protein
MDSDPFPSLMTAEQISAKLAVPKTRVYAAARSRELPSVRLGRYVRFDPAAVLDWIRAGSAGKIAPAT